MKTYLLLLVGFLIINPAHAQSPDSLPSETETAAVQEYLTGRNACLSQYQFGSVQATFTEDDSARTYEAGQAVTLSGTLTNNNSYPIPQGRLQARILRQDESVAADNWHPVVAEFDVAGDFSLAPNGTKPFSLSWSVPSAAPEGIYRAEVIYLAADRFSMSGLAFVPNFTASSQLFYVRNTGASSFIDFNRASVRLNGEPYKLRSVPPTFPAGTPLKIEVEIDAKHSGPLPVTVTSELHEWTESAANPPVSQSSQTVTLTPGRPQTLPFTWESPVAGAYEVVMKAHAEDATILPSIIKVRFPIAGNRPRIIFSGFTKTEGESAVVTTCAVNSTYGEGGGRLVAAVNGAQGTAVGSSEQPYDGQSLTTTSTTVSLADVAGGATIAVQAYNDKDELTDSHEIKYTQSDIDAFLTAQEAQQAEDQAPLSPQSPLAKLLIGIGVIVALVVILLLWMRRKRAVPPPPGPTPPPTPPRPPAPPTPPSTPSAAVKPQA